MTNTRKITSLRLLARWDADDTINTLYHRPTSPQRTLMKRPMLSKISTLSDGTTLDRCGWSESRKPTNSDILNSLNGMEVFRASTPRGGCTLFKTLYTNVCDSDCTYCVNTVPNREVYSYTPNEVARIFHTLYDNRLVQGLFLSSAMGKDPETTMAHMIDSVELLRREYAFRGYVHLKILPGASRYHVERAVQLANRVSLNIEEPTASWLNEVCSVKDFEVDLLKRQRWIRDLASQLSSGQVTQLIIGGTDETDGEILQRMHAQYQDLQLRRIYYSAFTPVPHTRSQTRTATPKWREHRLYQVDWLHRVYHYPIHELYDALVDDFLPNIDPKITLARLFIDAPVEVNDASNAELLRIPGIGPQSAARILYTRRIGERIQSRKQLVAMGVAIRRAQPFLKINGSYQPTLKNVFL